MYACNIINNTKLELFYSRIIYTYFACVYNTMNVVGMKCVKKKTTRIDYILYYVGITTYRIYYNNIINIMFFTDRFDNLVSKTTTIYIMYIYKWDIYIL